MATSRRKRPLTLHGLTYRFVTVTPDRFFGITQVPLEGQRIHITDREKTIVDCLTHPPYAGGVIEAAKGLWFGSEEIDLGRLVGYAEQNGSKAAMQRLGFWLERLGSDGALLRRIEAGCSQTLSDIPPVILSPHHPWGVPDGRGCPSPGGMGGQGDKGRGRQGDKNADPSDLRIPSKRIRESEGSVVLLDYSSEPEYNNEFQGLIESDSVNPADSLLYAHHPWGVRAVS